jgi:putative ABC transport system permease protein
MLHNWIIVALRNLRRRRLYSAINILGLAVGLAAALMIALYVRHELSFDRGFSSAESIWRVNRVFAVPGRTPELTSAQSLKLAPVLKEALPEVEAAVRVATSREIIQRPGDSRYQLVQAVDDGFFRLFDFPFLAGDPATALNRPDTAVLSRQTATRLFGAADPMGQALQLDNGPLLTVTGVFADPPSNSTLQPEFVTSVQTRLSQIVRSENNWGWNWADTYLLLKPGTDAARLEAALPDLMRRVRPNQGPDSSGEPETLLLQPLLDIHTRPLPGDSGTPMQVLLGLMALAVVILVVAAINFVNLSTAQATLRAREVALRKTLGAARHLIVGQFLAEALVLTLVAGLVALALVEVTMPGFQTLLGLRLDSSWRDSGTVLGLGGILILALGLMAGLYPALVLSGFRPAQVLRGGSGGPGGGRLRVGLVVLQFAAASALTVSTAVILLQTRHASTQQLGFDQENVVLLRGAGNPGVRPQSETLMDRLRAEPGVVSVAGAPWVPGDFSETTSGYFIPEDASRQTVTIRTDFVGVGYFETLGARLITGRTFERGRGSDQPAVRPDGAPPMSGRSGAALLSRSAVQRLGWGTPESAVGRTLLYPDDDGDVLLQIIGVVEDLQYKTARLATVPTIYQFNPQSIGTVMVRLAAGNGDRQQTLQRIESLWREMFPQVPVRVQFLDERVAALYAGDLRQARILAGFSGLAVLIACLGLFGLAAFTAQRRTREIGLRKVLGARTVDIVRLLIWHFSRPILLANLIALPVAWLLLSRWLEGYVSRITLNPLIFLAAALLTLLVAWITVAGHAARVARQRPVLALRYE